MPRAYVIPTVDTENMQSFLKAGFYDECCMETTLDGEEWGLSRLLDIFGEYGVRGTFFLATEERHRFGESHVSGIARRIVGKRHDVEVHSHPLWTEFGSESPREHLWEYSGDEQRALLSAACDCIADWTGSRPQVHRAGAYGINEDSFAAMTGCGIRADMSMFHGHGNCKICTTRNGVVSHGDIIEIPVTGFYRREMLRFGSKVVPSPEKFVKTDINAATADEFRYVLDSMKEYGGVMTLFAHSYSLMGFDSEEQAFFARPVIEEKLRAVLDMCIEDDDVVVLTARDFIDLYETDAAAFAGGDHVATFEKVVSGTDWLRRNRG